MATEVKPYRLEPYDVLAKSRAILDGDGHPVAWVDYDDVPHEEADRIANAMLAGLLANYQPADPPPPESKHACPRCGSDEWGYIDYGGCSECRPHEERESEDNEYFKPPLPGAMIRSYPGPWWCPSCGESFAVTLQMNHGEPCCPKCGGSLELQGTGDDECNQAAEIARELKEREFYGLANDRIAWLLEERTTLVSLLRQTTRTAMDPELKERIWAVIGESDD